MDLWTYGWLMIYILSSRLLFLAPILWYLRPSFWRGFQPVTCSRVARGPHGYMNIAVIWSLRENSHMPTCLCDRPKTVESQTCDFSCFRKGEIACPFLTLQSKKQSSTKIFMQSFLILDGSFYNTDLGLFNYFGYTIFVCSKFNHSFLFLGQEICLWIGRSALCWMHTLYTYNFLCGYWDFIIVHILCIFYYSSLFSFLFTMTSAR